MPILVRSADEALLATLPPAIMAEAQALQVGLFWCAVRSVTCQSPSPAHVPAHAKRAGWPPGNGNLTSFSLPPSLWPPSQARMQRHMARNQAMTEAMQAAAQQVGG